MPFPLTPTRRRFSVTRVAFSWFLRRLGPTKVVSQWITHSLTPVCERQPGLPWWTGQIDGDANEDVDLYKSTVDHDSHGQRVGPTKTASRPSTQPQRITARRTVGAPTKASNIAPHHQVHVFAAWHLPRYKPYYRIRE